MPGTAPSRRLRRSGSSGWMPDGPDRGTGGTAPPLPETNPAAGMRLQRRGHQSDARGPSLSLSCRHASFRMTPAFASKTGFTRASPPRQNGAGSRTLYLPVKVIHTGYATADEARMKTERNRVILEGELGRNPDAISIRFIYANTLVHANRVAEAQGHYERITKTPGSRLTQCDVYHGALVALADTHFCLGHYREARLWAERAAVDQPQSVQGWYQWGRALFAPRRSRTRPESDSPGPFGARPKFRPCKSIIPPSMLAALKWPPRSSSP